MLNRLVHYSRTMSDLDLRDLEAFVAVAAHPEFPACGGREARLGVEPQPAAPRHGRAARRPPDEPHHAQRRADRGWRSCCWRGSRPQCAMSATRWIRSGACAASPSGRLRINAPPPAIDLVLAPMVGPFLAAISADRSSRSSPRRRSSISSVPGFDAGVRYGEHLAQDMIAVSLGPPQRYVVVASPDYRRAAWQAEASEGSARPSLYPRPLLERRDAGLGVRESGTRREGRRRRPYWSGIIWRLRCARRTTGSASGRPSKAMCGMR